MGRQVVLKIERMAAGGLGLGRLEGRVVFLPGVLPREEVLVEILEGRTGYWRARPLEILETHPDRIDPPCPLFMVCGGCQLMHVAPQVQPGLKSEAALEKVLDGRDIQPEIIPSPFSLFYRDRVRFQVSIIKGRPALGFYAAGSKNLIPITFCFQVNPRINRMLPHLREWLDRGPSGKNLPSQLEILTGTMAEGILITLDFNKKPSANWKSHMAAKIDLGEPYFLSHTVKGAPGKPENGPENRKDEAVTWMEWGDLGLRLISRPGVFTQVNRGINRLLVEKAWTIVRENKPRQILDLYAGMGNLSLPLAGEAGRVVSVEENPAASACAKINLKINGLKNVHLVRRDSVRAVMDLAGKGERFDMIVLDPPRSGAKGLAIHAAKLQPRDILYISCHPAAMGRDLAEFTSLGYGPIRVYAFDMFPQTSHMEILAHLRRT